MRKKVYFLQARKLEKAITNIVFMQARKLEQAGDKAIRIDHLRSHYQNRSLGSVFLVPGTAYIHGMKHATGNFIILMDADLSHHVSQ